MTAFDAEWARCLPWIAATLARAPDAASAEEIKATIKADLAQFWPFEDCVFVTGIEDREDGRTIITWLAGGSLQGALVRRAVIENWARAVGCRFAVVEDTRKGWNRALRRYGFEPHGSGVRKVL